MMAKSREAFRTISEVADWLGVQAHVLRFWESKFAQVKPVKRAGGRRYYRPADMLLLGGIKKLLHDDGMTIKGVQKVLREQGVGYVADHSPSLDVLTIAQLDGEVANLRETIEETVLPAETPQIAVVQPESAVEGTAAAPADAVVSIQSDLPDVEAADAPQMETPEPDLPDHAAESAETVALSEPDLPEPDLPTPEAEDEPVQSEPPAIVEPMADEGVVQEVAAPEPAVEAPETTSAEPDAIDQEATAEEQRQPEPAVVLPSFMRKREEPAPAPVTKAPRVVDAPDGPPEDQIEVPPGLLARLAKLEEVPPSQIDKLRAVQAQLEVLHARLSGTGKE